MDYTSYLNPGTIKAQSNGAIEKYKKDNASLDIAQSSIESFAGNEEIKSAAFDNLKQQVSDMDFIMQSIRAANDAEIADHEALIAAVGDEELDGNHILTELDNARNTKIADEQEQAGYCLKATNPVPILREYYTTMSLIYGEMVRYDQQMIESWEAKEAKYDAIESATSGLFGSASAIRANVAAGMTDMGKAFQNGVYKPNMNAKWRTDLMAAQVNRLMTVGKDGTVTVNWEETEKVLRKDAGDITDIEYDILSQMYLKMEDKDLQKFLPLLMDKSKDVPLSSVTYSPEYGTNPDLAYSEWRVNSDKLNQILYRVQVKSSELLSDMKKGSTTEFQLDKLDAERDRVLQRGVILNEVGRIGVFQGAYKESPYFTIEITSKSAVNGNELLLTYKGQKEIGLGSPLKDRYVEISYANQGVFAEKVAEEMITKLQLARFDLPSELIVSSGFVSDQVLKKVKKKMAKKVSAMVGKEIAGETLLIVGSALETAADYQNAKKELEENIKQTKEQDATLQAGRILGAYNCEVVYAQTDQQEVSIYASEGLRTNFAIVDVNEAFKKEINEKFGQDITLEDILEAPLNILELENDPNLDHDKYNKTIEGAKVR